MSAAATPDPRIIGTRIAEARRHRGLTQRDLAELLGISLHALDRLEVGTADAVARLPRIAHVTQRPFEWFVESDMDSPELEESSPRAVHVSAGLGVLGRNLVLGSLVLLVTIRFLTEVVPVLPRAANFVDVPIFLTLGVAALFTPSRPTTRTWYLPVAVPAFAFFALSVLAVVANSNRVAVGPTLVFLYGFLAPLGLYAAIYRIWPPGNILALSRMLVALGVVQLTVVAFIDIPRFVASGNADVISGTFGTNAYQLVFFLLVFIGLVAGIATLEPTRLTARLAPLLIVAAFATILLAQYRSLLVGTVVAMIAIGLLLAGKARGAVIFAIAIVGFGLAWYFVAVQFPVLKFQSAASSLAQDPGTYARGRLEVAQNVFRLYGEVPTAIAVGTGPGTYSSRGWYTFAHVDGSSASDVASKYVRAITGGATYSTDVSDKYVSTQFKHGAIVEGSRAVSTPLSSYTALLAEVGVLGFTLICLVYLGAIRRAWAMARTPFTTPIRDDARPAVAVAALVAFLTLAQMALLENWLEVTRVTFIAWILLAVAGREFERTRSGHA